MKPFHSIDKSTLLCKPEFMNPPHSTKLDREFRREIIDMCIPSSGASSSYKGRCRRDNSVSNRGRKRRDGSGFHEVATPRPLVALGFQPGGIVAELSLPGSPT